jgi:hypothetical protein
MDMTGRPIKQGTIVQAFVIPPRGEAKWRPAVVFTPDDKIAAATELEVFGITISYFAEDANHIPLDWRHDGKCVTRLRRPRAIALNLKALVEKSAVNPTPGWIGRAALAELVTRVAEGT